LGCPGCFNPETHSFNGGQSIEIETLCHQIMALGQEIEGITISGGEPLHQTAAIAALLRRLRRQTSLSTILFTGFTWAEIVPGKAPRGHGHDHEGAAGPLWPGPGREESNGPAAAATWAGDAGKRPEVLAYVDVLIAGRYLRSRRLARDLRGSANKTIHFLTGRYTLADLQSVPAAEVVITPEGETLLSGIEPVPWAASRPYEL
jgi:anaerobic ribonucleoside-triphosphate reductase activating protein